MFIINFKKPSLCSDFKEYYDNYLRIQEEDYNNIPSQKFQTAANEKSRLILPKINSNYYYNKYKSNQNYKNKNNDYDGLNDRKKAINKVILNNNKSDLISEKCIRTGKYLMHNWGKKENKKSTSIRNKNNNYKGEYKYPYMNAEQKYYKEKFLDKKNWLNKKGFLPYIKRINNYNFIPNYVTATPSESLLLFHFRDISKDKWINPKGFH